MPTIATDSSLYVEKFKNQPGLFVRRVNGISLSDNELENYYIDELNKVGGKSKAYYITGLVLVQKENIKSIEIKEDEFIFTSNLCLESRNADPLSRLEYDEMLNKYFCELTKEEVKAREYTFDKQVINFIMHNIL